MDNWKPNSTTSICNLLYSKNYGPEHREEHVWGYYLTIGMIIYLDGRSIPDLVYYVHAAERSSHNPKDICKETVNKISSI